MIHTHTKKKKIEEEQHIFNQLKLVSAKCSKCPRTEMLTLDHIISKDIQKMFGVDIDHEIIDGNYQILCKSCNMFKSGKLDFSIPATKSLLINLLNARV